MKLLVTLGSGGHTTEMLRVVKLLGAEYDYHYVLVTDDSITRKRLPYPGTVHEVKRPRARDDSLLVSVFNSLRALYQITLVLLRVRPKAVIGCGPALSVLASWLGKALGAKVIFIETGCRVNTSSLSGKLMYPIADLFFVQWPQLKERFPKAIYAGRL